MYHAITHILIICLNLIVLGNQCLFSQKIHVTHKHFDTRAPIFTHTLALTLTHSLSLSLTHTNTNTYTALSLTHTHTYTHSLYHTLRISVKDGSCYDEKAAAKYMIHYVVFPLQPRNVQASPLIWVQQGGFYGTETVIRL